MMDVHAYRRLAIEVIRQARRELQPTTFNRWIATEGAFWTSWLPAVDARVDRRR